MERRLQKLILTALFAFSLSLLLAQDVSQERMIRFAVWASTEAYPGVEDYQTDNLSLPVKKIKQLSPFLLSGMIYGWNFEYVPYDKARGVEEFFEFSPINELSPSEIQNINFTKPWIENSRLYCWIEFRRSDAQIHIFKGWESCKNPKIKGTGYARLAEGYEGIEKASAQAIKNAVRQYQRKWIKSKPKEISGRIFIREAPQIGVTSGQYKVTLDFFMETDRIVEYKTF